ALEENDWETISDDLNTRPIEGIDGSQDKNTILMLLEKYGIKLNSRPYNINFPNKVSIEIWGSGLPMREFLWSEEMADACIFLMKNRDFHNILNLYEEIDNNKIKEIRNTHINIGTGREISIAHLAEITKIIIKFQGELFFNTSKPDGAPRKLTDTSKLKALGWKYSIELDEGIFRLYQWYKSSIYNPALIKNK